jgi:hypothetical protein
MGSREQNKMLEPNAQLVPQADQKFFGLFCIASRKAYETDSIIRDSYKEGLLSTRILCVHRKDPTYDI